MYRMDAESRSKIKNLAELTNCCPEEYLKNVIRQHKENLELRKTLLEDREAFAAFVKEYMAISEKLYPFQLLVTKTISDMKLENPTPMVEVFKEIFYLTTHDTSILLHLYEVYKSHNH